MGAQKKVDSPRRLVALPLVCSLGIGAGLLAVALYSGARPGGAAFSPGKGETVQIVVDTAQTLHPISPEIYGMSSPSEQHLKELRLKLWRWGGNPSTRYNWEGGNFWNAAHDWEYRNGNYNATSPEDRLPSGNADKAIALGNRSGASAYLTIPTMGWVAKDDNNATLSVGVPAQGSDPVSPGSEAVSSYNPAENRRRVSVKSFARKGKPFSDSPDLKDGAVYQDEWVAHLVKKFGKASGGGVRYYAMDNEPDLWDTTHTDMHPVRPDYNELWTQFATYASAIKDVDSTSQIGGPTSWGWTGYFYSPRDRGNDNYASHADRKAHGDTPFLPWFLKQAANSDKKQGRRTLDILDVHYYPQGQSVYSSASDDATNVLRLRSTRSLWDASYRDESWINENIQLIPRLKGWVKENYPGTKIGVMEWNWGADNTLNGAIAIAEVLGIFGREGVDMASYWGSPAPGSPGYFAFLLYRNADGNGAGFGDTALSSVSNAPDRVSCFAARDTKSGATTLMLINKQLRAEPHVSLDLKGLTGAKTARLIRYSGENLKKPVQLPDISFDGGKLSMRLPASSITLVRVARP